MKAYWDDADYYKMTRNTLRFTEYDIDLIHCGLQQDPVK